MGKKKQQIEVAEYRMSMHLGLCQGVVDSINLIEIGDKISWAGKVTTNTTIDIARDDLFGGLEKEGGVDGHAHVLLGGPTQLLPEFVAAKFGRTSATIPGFRGLASLYFTNRPGERDGFYWTANSPFIQNIAVGVTAIPRALNTQHAAIPRLGSTPASSQIVNLDSTTDGGSDATAGLANGVTISGFNPADVLQLTLPTGQTWIAYSPWGVPALSGPQTGSVTTFKVIRDADTGDVSTFGEGGPFDGFEAARAAFTTAFITGNSSYTFYIEDTPLADNAGGLSIQVDLLEQNDANPAHIIYEALTNRLYGAGVAASNIDVASFEAAAATLFDEQFGLTFKWVLETSVQEFVNEVLDHIEAVLFVDPTTGLLTLKLIRQDYIVGNLRVVDPSSAQLDNFERPGIGETVNEIQVTWTDPATEKDATTPAIQDLANIAAQGGVVSDSRNFYGVRSKELALKLGYRELFAASSPLATAELTLDRQHWDVVDGEAFVLDWPERGIVQLVMRVVDLDRGAPKRSPIRISAVEDVFGLDLAVFETPPDSLHVNTDELPSAIDHTQIMTLPFFMVANEIDPAVSSAIEFPDVFAGILAGQDGADTARYKLLGETTDALGNNVFDLIATNTILSRATLEATLTAEALSNLATFPTRTQGDGPKSGTLLVIGSGGDDEREIAVVSVADPGGAGYTILRGMLDTTPKEWPAGTPVFLINDGAIFTDDTVRAASTVATYKLLPITSLGTFAEASASALNYTMTERPHLPTRPANVKVNGVAFGVADGTGSPAVAVTFATRNRLTEDSTLQAWTNAAVTEEAGQTSTVLVKKLNDALLATHDDVSSGFIVPPASYAGEAAIKIQVIAKRTIGSGSPATVLESLQGHEITVTVANVLQLQNDDPLTLQDGDSIELNG